MQREQTKKCRDSVDYSIWPSSVIVNTTMELYHEENPSSLNREFICIRHVQDRKKKENYRHFIIVYLTSPWKSCHFHWLEHFSPFEQWVEWPIPKTPLGSIHSRAPFSRWFVDQDCRWASVEWVGERSVRDSRVTEPCFETSIAERFSYGQASTKSLAMSDHQVCLNNQTEEEDTHVSSIVFDATNREFEIFEIIDRSHIHRQKVLDCAWFQQRSFQYSKDQHWSCRF